MAKGLITNVMIFCLLLTVLILHYCNNKSSGWSRTHTLDVQSLWSYTSDYLKHARHLERPSTSSGTVSTGRSSTAGWLSVCPHSWLTGGLCVTAAPVCCAEKTSSMACLDGLDMLCPTISYICSLQFADDTKMRGITNTITDMLEVRAAPVQW